MRYEAWDILLFPRDCKVPFKEFKVACHVVHDNEFAHTHGSVGLPTVCCFVPSMAPGSLYKLSIHSWSTPPFSQFARSYSKYLDDMTFEARLFVDGRLASSTSFERDGPWPNVMKNSLESSAAGDIEPLKFPAFQRELLQQSYWSPADELGRLRLVISEVFPRDSTSAPKERVKNVVAFAFQHAPLDVLESSSIAWPSPSMWRTMPFSSSTSLACQSFEDAQSHAHSPHGRYTSPKALPSVGQPEDSIHGRLFSQKSSLLKKQTAFTNQADLNSTAQINFESDPFIEANAYFEWLSGMGMGLQADNLSTQAVRGVTRDGRKSSTDVSMPDYLPSDQAIHVDMVPFEPKNDNDTTTVHMKTPTNTPLACDNEPIEREVTPFPLLPHGPSLSLGLANSLTHSLLRQPMPLQLPNAGIPIPSMEVRSRKENQLHRKESPPAVPGISVAGRDGDCGHHVLKQRIDATSEAQLPDSVLPSAQEGIAPDTNKVNNSQEKQKSTPEARDPSERRAKRLRNITPASSKLLDDDGDPRRASPRIRLSRSMENTADGK